MRELKMNLSRIFYILLFGIVSTGSCDTDKNTSIKFNKNQDITLSKKQIEDTIEYKLLLINVMHQCAEFDNVKNKIDVAMCTRSAIVNWQASIFDGKKLDASDTMLYQRWYENYKSTEKDKHIFPVEKKEFDTFYNKYQLCLNEAIKLKVFNNSQEIRQYTSKECNVEFERVLIIKPLVKYSNDGLSNIIAKDIKYPEEARRNHQEGDVIVSFTQLPSGEIIDLVIEKSSGYKLLDDATLALIKRSAPNLPKSVTGPRHISIPINYSLK